MQSRNDNLIASAQHPHGEDISAYLDGMLDVRKMRNIAQHIESCSQCSELRQSLRQVKVHLNDLAAPPAPPSDYWANTYRAIRVDSQKRQSWVANLRQSVEPGKRQIRRRLAIGFAALVLIGGAIATPRIINAPTGEPATYSTADVVDLSSLVRAHTQFAASQPLSVPDRQTMISADTDDAFEAHTAFPEATGDGGSLAADSAH